MARRRDYANEWFGDSHAAGLILGQSALHIDEQLRGSLEVPTFIDQAVLRKSLETQLRQRLDAVRRHLRNAADWMAGDIDKMFRQYFERQPDVEAAARRIGLEYVGDERIEADAEQLWRWLKKVDPTLPVSKEKIRRRLIAEEVADVLAQRLEHDAMNEADDVIPDEMLLEILRDRKAWVEERKRMMVEQLDHVAPLVHERLLGAAKDGTLPVEALVVEERLAMLLVDVLDPLAYRFDDVYGEFDPEHHAVHLSAAIPYESEHAAGVLEQVYTHEVLHAISGQQELLVWTGMPEDEDDEVHKEQEYDRDGVQTRVGLRLSSGLKREQLDWEQSRRSRYLQWLNEAVTERLTQQISGIQEVNAYKLQREFLQRLIDAGLEEEVVKQAYFENDTRKEAGHRMPAMKELFDQTNKRFGRGFLLGLDALIRDGVKKSKERSIAAENNVISNLLRAWDKNRAIVIARAVKRGQRRQAPSGG